MFHVIGGFLFAFARFAVTMVRGPKTNKQKQKSAPEIFGAHDAPSVAVTPRLLGKGSTEEMEQHGK
jgi:hypothetical protein